MTVVLRAKALVIATLEDHRFQSVFLQILPSFISSCGSHLANRFEEGGCQGQQRRGNPNFFSVSSSHFYLFTSSALPAL